MSAFFNPGARFRRMNQRACVILVPFGWTQIGTAPFWGFITT
jgi:hypothetical protein